MLRGIGEMIPKFADMAKDISDAIMQGLRENAPKMVASAPGTFEIVGKSVIESIANGILENGGKIAEAVVASIANIILYIEANGEALAEAGRAVVDHIAAGFKTIVSFALRMVDDFIETVVYGFLTYKETLFTVGIEILSAIGRGIVENKYEFQNMASKTIQNLVNALRANAPMIIEGGFAILEILSEAIIDNLPLIVQAGSELIRHFVHGISQALPAVQAIIRLLLLPKMLKMIEMVISVGNVVITVISGIITGLQSLWAVMMANPVSAVVVGIAALIAAFATLWNNCEEFRSFWIGLWETIKTTVSTTVDFVVDQFRAGWELIKEAWSHYGEFFGGVWDGIKNIFANVWNEFKRVGGQIVSGIWEGVVEATSWLWEKLSGFFGGIVDGVKDLLGIHSPSRVFAGIDENMALGLEAGWDNEYSQIKKKIEGGMDFGTANVDFASSGLAVSSNRIASSAF